MIINIIRSINYSYANVKNPLIPIQLKKIFLETELLWTKPVVLHSCLCTPESLLSLCLELSEKTKVLP